MDKKIVAIIVAGGGGSRMGADRPKQFLPLGGRPMIAHSLEAFNISSCITDIVVVCRKGYIEDVRSIIDKYGIDKAVMVTEGGTTRQASSLAGIKICPSGTEYVLIHDAARPFINEGIIERTLEAARGTGASTSAVRTVDTVAETEEGIIKTVPEREKMVNIQTPQGFRYDLIMEAHKRAEEEGICDSSDDCGLVTAMGKPVAVVKGSAGNVKVTSRFDLVLAENTLRSLKDDPEGADL